MIVSSKSDCFTHVAAFQSVPWTLDKDILSSEFEALFCKVTWSSNKYDATSAF
jgi:hypothetical protein